MCRQNRLISTQTPAARLAAALDGDRVAWDCIVDEYVNLLWWIARSHRLDDATAADVVQTVWLQLVKHGQSIKEPDRLGAWLAQVARREAQRRVKESKRQVPHSATDDRPERNAIGPEEHVLDDELISAALVVFHRLSEPCRRLLTLLFQGMSYEEVFVATGTPKGSIGPTRNRCLAHLRDELEGMGF